VSKRFSGTIDVDIRDYPGERPFAFTGGTIKEAVIDLSGEEYVDLEREALAMTKRE
jgi:hypothetical protein